MSFPPASKQIWLHEFRLSWLLQFEQLPARPRAFHPQEEERGWVSVNMSVPDPPQSQNLPVLGMPWCLGT